MSRRLRANSVCLAYEHGKPVLVNTNVEVRGGVVTGIVGPNGSGKSTLLRVLAGLLRADSGDVLLDGARLHSHSRRVRAQTIGFLPQEVSPAFSLTVFEVVCLGRYPHLGALGVMQPRDFEVAERCLDQTGTLDLRDRDFLALSGGERQRALLASILAQEPSLLLLDEPTSALDVHHQIEVFDLLRHLASQGYGVGVVTHDLNLAGRFCDEILLLSDRRREESVFGAPRDVLTSEKLTQAYGAPIQVCDHPLTGAPLINADVRRETTP